ncbi:MAG: hypothetical protein ACT4O1_16675 [Gemmatimonadota bacterium]
MSSEWTVIASYASTTEADIYLGILHDANIPAVVRADVGIFGAGFSGATARGASIAVPEQYVEHAHELIGHVMLDDEEDGLQ